MMPVGYMAKRVCKRPDYLRAPSVIDIYSVSGCVSEDFADYIVWWKHNGYWLFDSPEIIRTTAQENEIDLDGTLLFYYEAYEMEFDGKGWSPYQPDFEVNVVPPVRKQLEGFDVVTFFARNAPECSPLSCNSLAETIPTNFHCLLTSFEEAYARINSGEFSDAEPGPYRIFSVYSTDWALGQ
jgi:hypothetical protein